MRVPEFKVERSTTTLEKAKRENRPWDQSSIRGYLCVILLQGNGISASPEGSSGSGPSLFYPSLEPLLARGVYLHGPYALLAISWDMLICAGLVSLGQSLFYGIGSYIAGVLNHYWGWSPLLTIPAATLMGGLLCTMLLLPVLRLRGIYFAMVTLVLPLMLARLVEATRILGGTEGLTGLDRFPQPVNRLLRRSTGPAGGPVWFSKDDRVRLRLDHSRDQ